MKHNNLLKKMMASAVAFSMMAGSLPLMPAADEAVVQSEILPETSGPQTDAPASSQGTSGSETQVLPSQDSKLESQDLNSQEQQRYGKAVGKYVFCRNGNNRKQHLVR